MRHFGCRGGESVPEGGGCHTEGSVAIGLEPDVGGGGGESRPASEDRNFLDGDVGVEEVGKAVQGEGMEGFVGYKKGFVVEAGFDGEPVEVDGRWGDVLPGPGVVEYSGSRVLDLLEPVQGFAWNPGQDSIPIIQSSI